MNDQPLEFDPIARAADLWAERVGPSEVMAAVTSVMRVQQILQSAVDGALRPHGLTFARYEALVLLYFSRRGSHTPNNCRDGCSRSCPLWANSRLIYRSKVSGLQLGQRSHY